MTNYSQNLTKFFKECYEDYPFHLLMTPFWYENGILSYNSSVYKSPPKFPYVILKYE